MMKKLTRLIGQVIEGVLPLLTQRMDRRIALLSMLMMMAMPSFSQTSSCPDSNHPHLIDLGLPSGTRWACCNVDAKSPEHDGGYYAWGETEEKVFYSAATYTFSPANGHQLTAEEDVATVKWGSKWCMPRLNEIDELLAKCQWSWEKVNGIIGAVVTGPNGESIFLPASGFKDENDNWSVTTWGSYGSYWGSTHGSSSDYGIELIFGVVDYLGNHPNCEFYWKFGPTGVRRAGRSVRPIYAEKKMPGNDYTIYITNPNYDYDYYGGWEGTPLGGYNPDNNAEHFNTNFNTFQTLHGLLPGKYRLGVQGCYRKGTADNDYALWLAGDTKNSNALLYAISAVDSYSVPLVSPSSAALPKSLGGSAHPVGDGLFIPDNMVAAGAWFKADYYHNYLIVEVGNDGELTIGVKKEQLIDRDWTVIDNWTLIRLDDDSAIGKLSKTSVKDSRLFNLCGQRVDANYKGVVIKNGQKMIQK